MPLSDWGTAAFFLCLFFFFFFFSEQKEKKKRAKRRDVGDWKGDEKTEITKKKDKAKNNVLGTNKFRAVQTKCRNHNARNMT